MQWCFFCFINIPQRSENQLKKLTFKLDTEHETYISHERCFFYHVIRIIFSFQISVQNIWFGNFVHILLYILNYKMFLGISIPLVIAVKLGKSSWKILTSVVHFDKSEEWMQSTKVIKIWFPVSYTCNETPKWISTHNVPM